MASQVLMPDDDGDLSEKMKILLAKKASLERELDIIEKRRALIAAAGQYSRTNAN